MDAGPPVVGPSGKMYPPGGPAPQPVPLRRLTNSEYLFTQTLSVAETQRLFKQGRTIGLSFGYNVF